MIPQRIQWFGRGALIAGAVLFVALVGFLIYLDATLPPVARLENPEFSLPTAIYDRHGTKVDEVFIYRRKLVTYDQLPQTLINALLAKEDTRFWSALALSAEEKVQTHNPTEMARLADALPIDRIASRWIVSTDPEEHLDRIAPYVDLGFRHLVFHAPGADQMRFLSLYSKEVLPRLRKRFG